MSSALLRLVGRGKKMWNFCMLSITQDATNVLFVDRKIESQGTTDLICNLYKNPISKFWHLIFFTQWYRPRKILSDGLKTNSSYLLSSYLSKVQKVPFESPAQGLSHGTLKSDLGLKMASAEAKNMKKWTFFKLDWSKGQLTFEGQL